MKEYHKIQSLYKRDETTHKFIESEYSLPEFGYLSNAVWVGTEKIDGTNIRVKWSPEIEVPVFAGRTDRAQIYGKLVERLTQLFPADKLRETFGEESVCLYGEGFGAKIQKGGGNYIEDGVDFILFDIRIGDWWLELENTQGLAKALDVLHVPVVYTGPLNAAVEMVKRGFNSHFGEFTAEGMVLKPKLDLYNRHGSRIVTKIKHKDWV